MAVRKFLRGAAVPGALVHDVDISIEGACVNTVDRVVIDDTEYAHGETATLTEGDHTLTWTQNCGMPFLEWDDWAGVSVADKTAESTTLTVSGDGELYLYLTAEQFENGGFETGDLSGWTATGDWAALADGYAGSYYAGMEKTGEDLSVSGTLEQQLSSPISVACIVDTCPTFQIATYYGYGCSYTITTWKIEIIYTDDTVTELDISGDSAGSWTLHDLKSILETGKTVKTIRITGDMWAAFDPEMRVDECTLAV